MDGEHLIPETIIQLWVCPNCKQTGHSRVEVTRGFAQKPHARFHHCAGLRGLWAPMVTAESRVQVTAVEREDYVGEDEGNVPTDENGRPVMAVRTDYADGSNDLAVMAPTATLGGS